MTEDTSRLYLYVKDWERHQPRSDRPNLPWLRLHTDLLGNDAWLELSTADRCLLIGIWMVTQRYGNGRLLADERWLKSQAKAHKSSLDRLVQAGFITLSTTKAEPFGGLEENRIERKEEKKPDCGAKKAPARLPENPRDWIPDDYKQHTREGLALMGIHLTEQEFADATLDDLHALRRERNAVHDSNGERAGRYEPMSKEELKEAIAAIRPQLGEP